MANYKRVAFNEKWWEEVKEYLKNNPQEGFDEKQAKQFIKVIVNRHMNDEMSTFDEEEFLDKLKEKLDV